MSQSITTDVCVHIDGKDAHIECQELTTAAGRLFAILRVGPVDFYPSRAQLRSIRDVIDAFLDDSPAPFVPSEADWADASALFGDRDRQISPAEQAMLAAGMAIG